MLVEKGIKSVCEFLQSEDGHALTEYGMILLLVSIVSVAVLTTLGQEIRELLEQVLPFGDPVGVGGN